MIIDPVTTAVACGAGVTALGVVFVCAAGVGRALRGSFGAFVAAAVVAAFGILLQWALLRPQDGSVLEWLRALLLDGAARGLFDLVRSHLGVRNRFFEFAGPLIAIIAALGLATIAGLGGAAGRLLDVPAARRLLEGSRRRVYRLLFITVAIIALWLSVVPTFEFGTPGYNDMVRTAWLVVWAVPALAFGILWQASLATPKRKRAAAAAAVPAEAAPEPSLAALFESYRADYADTLLLARPAEPGRAAPPDTAAREPATRGDPHGAGETAARILKASRDNAIHPGADWGAALAEALSGAWGDPSVPSTEAMHGIVLVSDVAPSALTFLVIAELALSAQDRGATALIVTAEGGVERMAAELSAALSAYAGAETHRIHDGYGQPKGYYDVVISSVQRLETEILSARDPGLEDAVRRIGFVVVLDLAHIDAALLRLRFVHLSSLIGGRRPLVLVQSDPQVGLNAQVKSLLAPLGSYEDRALVPPRDAGARWLIIWRNDRPTLEAIFRTDLAKPTLPPHALEIAPFLLVRAWNRGFSATFYDVAGRVDRTLWDQTLTELAGAARGVLDSVEREGVNTGRLPYPNSDDRVVVVEDLANLAEAVKRTANFRHRDEILVHVLSHDYPLREYLATRLDHAIATGDFAWLDAYLPIAPDPEGGPAELALAVATAVLDHPDFTVSEAVLQKRIEDFGSASAMTEFDGTTRDGLAALLTKELGRTPAIIARRKPGHERNFVFHNLEGLRLDPAYLVPLQRDTHQDQRRVWLDRGDHGLTYARATTIQVFGTYYEIDSVDAHKITVSTAQSLPTHIGDPRRPGSRAVNRPRFRFGRLYCVGVHDAEIEVISAVSTVAARRCATLRLLALGPVERASVALCAWAELEAPFSFAAPSWQGRWAEVEMPRGMRIHLRYALPEGAPPPGDPGLARIAFTLAATLQDVLASFFPRNGERLAVMSPQAEAAISAVLRPNGGAPPPPDRGTAGVSAVANEYFPCEWYPRLVDTLQRGAYGSDGLNQPPADRARFVQAVARLVEAHAIDPSGTPRFDRATVRRLAEGESVIDLVLIEDASHDLGCLRALFPVWDRVADVWRDYLGWCAANTRHPHFHYRFGAAHLAQIFDFAGARALLDEIGDIAPGDGP